MFRYIVEEISTTADRTVTVQLIGNPLEVRELFCRDIECPKVQKIEVKNDTGQTAMLFLNEELTCPDHQVAENRPGRAWQAWRRRDRQLATLQ